MNGSVKRRKGEISNAAFFHGTNQNEHVSLNEKRILFNAESCLSHAVQLPSPPVLRNLDLVDLKMLGLLLQDLPTACIFPPGKTEVSTDVHLNPILFRKRGKTTLSSITSFLDLLQATQSLLVVQVKGILHNDCRIGEFTRIRQHRLLQLSYRLWLEAPPSLPNAMTPHAAWKLGESVRRTIIASHLLVAITRACDTGVVQYEPFLTSLPFDRRIALWKMEVNDPWLVYIDAEQTPLVSLQEWLNGNENSHVAAASVLQRILLILYQPWTNRKLYI